MDARDFVRNELCAAGGSGFVPRAFRFATAARTIADRITASFPAESVPYRIAPDLLLGILFEVAERIPLLSAHRTHELAQRGGARLRQRRAEKRTWTVHHRAVGTHRVELSTRELHVLFRALGIPPEADLRELVRLVRTALDRTANAAADRR